MPTSFVFNENHPQPKLLLKSLGSYQTAKPVSIKQIIDLVQHQLPTQTQSMGYALTINEVYSADQVPISLKETILEKYHAINVENDDWYQPVYSYWQEELKLVGFIEANVSFTGFWNQGDGASFTAMVDLEAYLKAHKLGRCYRAALVAAKAGEVSIKIYRKDYLAVPDHSIAIATEYLGSSQKVQDQIDELATKILNHAREFSKQIYENLMQDYDYLTSAEAIWDTLTCNDYCFTSEGNIYPGNA